MIDDGLSALLQEHSRLTQEFEAKFHLKCECGQSASDYLPALAKVLCGICLKEVPNRKEVVVESLASLNLQPLALRNKISQQNLATYVLDAVALLFQQKLKRLQLLKSATLQQLSRQFKFSDKSPEIIARLVGAKSKFIRAEGEQSKLFVLRQLFDVASELEEHMHFLKEQFQSTKGADIRMEVENRLQKLDLVFRQIEDIALQSDLKRSKSSTRSNDYLLRDYSRVRLQQDNSNSKSSPKQQWRKETERVERFRTERNRLWSHPRNCTDAICLLPKCDLLLRGFISYEVVDWRGLSQISCAISITQSGKLLYSDKVTLRKRECKDSKLEIHFNDQIVLVSQRRYDLALRNLGENYRTKSGIGCLENELMAFERSRLDNNGSKVDEGQFLGVVVSRRASE